MSVSRRDQRSEFRLDNPVSGGRDTGAVTEIDGIASLWHLYGVIATPGFADLM
jgi:hypothetical protein